MEFLGKMWNLWDLPPRTSLSAPSMQRYLAPRNGFALRRTLANKVPVKRAVESPAGPHEKPFDFRTVFCSFRRFPAHTKVMGRVICSNCSTICCNVILNGFSTRLRPVNAVFSQPGEGESQCLPLDANLPRPDLAFQYFGDRTMISDVKEIDGGKKPCASK